MIDWHSHVLPGIDDGSRNVAESISMIHMQASQGIKTVIATPHFYANDESVDSFLERRAAAVELLKAQLPQGVPEIRCGAEVRYYPGISHLEGLKSLRIEGSKLLLLEMPTMGWTEYTIRELIALSGRSDIRIVLAHTERYMRFQKRAVWDELRGCGILMQANASFFTAWPTRHKAISLLREGNIHFVGSDGHNMTSRQPQIGKAFQVIRKKLGAEYISQMSECGYSMLTETNIS